MKPIAARASTPLAIPPAALKLETDDGARANADNASRIVVAVLTPTGRDGIVASHLLGRFGIQSALCSNMDEICQLISEDSIGVILVAEEALIKSERSRLFESLNQQPSWSDIPIILLTGEGELSSSLPRALSGLVEKGNITLLERPVRVATLTTLIRSAQRARLRQLDVRDYIERRNESEEVLRESEQRLRSAVLSAPYPLMLHAEGGEILQLSRAWTSLTGYDAASILTTGEWMKRAYPDNESGGSEFGPIDSPEGVSVHLGERQIQTATGSVRTWDFHRVALGTLPDGRRVNLTAAIDVTAYKQLVESERSARRQAEEANSAKSQFLATMSHELRTPLNAISGYTQLLSLGLRGPVTPEQQEDLDRIDRSQRHLLSLINDILNFAKIEAGHIAVENAPVAVSRILDGLKEFVEPQLREKNLNFSVVNSCPGAVGRGDEDKVRQILINLLSNAIKFTAVNGRINVECSANDGSVNVHVTDDGAGIPPDKLEAIFEPFVQVGRDFSSPQGGTGLGLSISRDLARRMGGDLEVESELGKGSTFTLILQKDE
ncbi:MAG TPA: ATP-binding protein [Gemmatimonadaceae bacterium]|nr:ATP-binding protein [Gemmatimonadaceae bacterium]